MPQAASTFQYTLLGNRCSDLPAQAPIVPSASLDSSRWPISSTSAFRAHRATCALEVAADRFRTRASTCW